MGNENQQEVFLGLLENVNDDLGRFAEAMTGDYDEAKDIVGETILRAYESFGKIRDHGAFKSYLFSIASRLFKRKKRRLKIFGEYNEDAAAEIPATGASPETETDIKFLYSILGRLPAKQKEAVILFEISGFQLEEIRQIQGGTLSGVKSRLRRARENLAEMIKDDESRAEESGAFGKRKNGTAYPLPHREVTG